MNAQNSIRDLFFEEAEDLLHELNDGVAAVEASERDPEILNVIFRAVHSLKGGGATFGFNDLVGFAHTYETLLDRVRKDASMLDATMVALIAQSAVVMGDLVYAARDNRDVCADKVNAATTALEAIVGDTGQDEAFEFAAVAADLDFDISPVPIETGPQTFHIRFAPSRDLYSCGNEPLVLIRALEDFGQPDIAADLSALPAFDAFDWEDSYLAWNITLTTQASAHNLREVFEFVDDLCDLSIDVAPSPTDTPPETADETHIAQNKG